MFPFDRFFSFSLVEEGKKREALGEYIWMIFL